ncbi:MAG: hypothetical protein DMG58_03920 [Acidobacteria bacterium]|nr:MAG: hypothetical protein DMG58_03920 [Acidobacteriota bacterium]
MKIASSLNVSPRITSRVERNGSRIIDNPAAAQEAICESTVTLGSAIYGDNLKAIVLTGSLARHEGTCRPEHGFWTQFGDAEFLLVLKEEATLPLANELLNLQKKRQSELLNIGVKCAISLAAVHPAYLRRLRPHIFAYELLVHGRVLWGEPVISLVPPFSSTEIPLEDAWRLLCNRMIELLEVSVMITDDNHELPKEVFYKLLKLYIDMGTSLLVFVGAYEPTYAGRAKRMQFLEKDKDAVKDCPLDLARFTERVVACTRCKLSGGDRLQLAELGWDSNSLGLWETAIADARSLWRWELSRLTRTVGAYAEDRPTDDQLMITLMQKQAIGQRVRAWLSLLRRQGWRRSRLKWPGWVWHALRASPRYRIYSAATKLLFQLPSWVAQGHEANSREDELLLWLPIRSSSLAVIQSDWRQAAAEIAWNYHEFLVGTQA